MTVRTLAAWPAENVTVSSPVIPAGSLEPVDDSSTVPTRFDPAPCGTDRHAIDADLVEAPGFVGQEYGRGPLDADRLRDGASATSDGR